jgi:hypothetical protein
MNGTKARTSRRTWLKRGFLGLGLVSVGGIGLALQKPKLRDDTPALKVLDPAEYAILVAIADRLCPALAADAPGALALGLPAQLDTLLQHADAEAQQGLKVALRLMDNALPGALAGERVTPFTKLSGAEQDRSLVAWRDSSVGFRRTVYGGVSGAIMPLYWGHPRTWPRLGYKGPPDVAGLRAAYADQLVNLDSLRATPVAKGT